ncbi:MAG TPA: peptidylprolyl isomerase, partial [Vicinamibacteria bacterium]|nr:peptidylprolyl isomerase [Vicinamibacteria bacterium]
RTRSFEEMKEFARKRAAAAKLEAKHEAFLNEVGKKHGLVRSYERLEDPMVPDDAKIIVVGSSSLTMRQLVERLPPPLIEHLFNEYFPVIHRFLDGIALEEVLIQEAEARGIGQRPVVVESVRVATEEVRSQAALEDRLKKKVAALPEKELRDYFKQNEKRFQTLRTYDLDVILLKPMPKENFWRVLKRGEALAKRIEAGEDFAALAREHSRHYTAREGGRMMGLTDQDIAQRVQSTAKFRRMLAALKDGEVGPAMVAECYDPERLVFEYTGALVVRLVKNHPPVPQTYEQVKDLVAESYLRRHRQRLEAETKKTVLESVAFRVHPERLPPL